MGLRHALVLFVEFTVVIGRPRKILTRDFILLGAPAAFGIGSRFASSRAAMRIIGRTTFPVVVGLLGFTRDSSQLRLYLRQLLDQFLGISWDSVVQTIVFILHFRGDVAHQQVAHFKRRHRHIAAFDARRAIRLVLEARQTWREVVQLLNTLVKVLDGQPWGLPDRHIHVNDVTLGSIFITHCEQVETLEIC